ncbi:MAG TPA: hypothetical protein VFQ73_02060 [Flavisolibacter sp.]|nr:hypothetical protein [Flavisolibacter sp.]
MADFKKNIANAEFNFNQVKEGNDLIFLVTVDNQSFRMTTDEDGYWGIWQQVPRWIKALEGDLANAIEEQ